MADPILCLPASEVISELPEFWPIWPLGYLRTSTEMLRVGMPEEYTGLPFGGTGIPRYLTRRWRRKFRSAHFFA